MLAHHREERSVVVSPESVEHVDDPLGHQDRLHPVHLPDDDIETRIATSALGREERSHHAARGRERGMIGRRPSQENALNVVDANIPAEPQLALRFDALRDDENARDVRHADRSRDEDLPLRIVVHVRDEKPVELDPVGLGVVEQLQPGIARTEVIERQFEPASPQRLQCFVAARPRRKVVSLGDLEVERTVLQAVSSENPLRRRDARPG